MRIWHALALLFCCSQALGSDWQRLPTSASETGEPVSIALTAEPCQHLVVSAESARGQWLRLSAQVPAGPPPSLRIVAGKEKTILSESPPFTCRPMGASSSCSAAAWIPQDATTVRATLCRFPPPSTYEAVQVERGRAAAVDPRHADQLRKVMHAVRDRYYLTQEVDWAPLFARVETALAVPPDLDPVPGAVQYLIRQLPGNRHTFLMPIVPTATATGAASAPLAALPSCDRIDGVWRLKLTNTALTPRERHAEYVGSAQECLLRQAPGTPWVIDLRQHGGGDSHTTLAAVASLLPAGPLLKFVEASGAEVSVDLTPEGVKTEHSPPRPAKPPAGFAEAVGSRLQAPLVLWIGPGCLSSCEIAAAVLAERGILVGLPTGGLNTANTVMGVNDGYQLVLTFARIRNRRGELVPERLVPAVVVQGDDFSAVIRALPSPSPAR